MAQSVLRTRIISKVAANYQGKGVGRGVGGAFSLALSDGFAALAWELKPKRVRFVKKIVEFRGSLRFLGFVLALTACNSLRKRS